MSCSFWYLYGTANIGHFEVPRPGREGQRCRVYPGEKNRKRKALPPEPRAETGDQGVHTGERRF